MVIPFLFSQPVVFCEVLATNATPVSVDLSTSLSETDGLHGNHSSIGDSWPIAFFGYPRGHRVNNETDVPEARDTPTIGVDTLPRTERLENRPASAWHDFGLASDSASTLKRISVSMVLD